jgi:hypothetical protein
METLASYRRAGELRRVVIADGLAVDLGERGPAYLLAELGPGEGKDQVLALLHGDGAYLDRVQAGEEGLCRRLARGELAEISGDLGGEPAARAA